MLSARPVVTRASRRDPRGAKLESVAAEFALLAQRRARLARQVDLLSRQLDAAAGSLAGVHARMAMLAQRIGRIDPDMVADGAAPELVPVPPAPVPPPYAKRPGYQPAYLPVPAKPAEVKPPASLRDSVPHRAMRHVPRRRPFLSE
jgi:hypothetical protein